MRIAYILNTLQVGGAERQVLAVAERMQARGHAVMIVALREHRPHHLPTSLDAIHLNMRKQPLSMVPGYARAVSALRTFRPDLIHSHQFHGNMLARLLKPAMPSVPVLSTIHNIHEGGGARMLAYRLTDPLATRTIAVCQAAADRFLRIGALSAQKTLVIPNGVDCAAFTPDPARRSRIRAELDASDAFIWLAVGRLTPAKDYPNLLRAFALVHAAHPDACLWIAGEGKQKYIAGFKKLSGQLGIAPALHWLGLRSDIAALLDAADAFALSSAWEGMPLALGEAMAMEKPFVATDVGGVREIAGSCGTMVPPHDPAALAAAMIAVMETSLEQRRVLGHAAQHRIATDFSIEASVRAWESCYTDILAARV
jgi:glycosyltransferase involved in cell wall biosynthesis